MSIDVESLESAARALGIAVIIAAAIVSLGVVAAAWMWDMRK